MKNIFGLNYKTCWIIIITLILILLYKYEKENFSPLEDYPPDPLPTVSKLKYNYTYINNKDQINDNFESIFQFNKLFLPNKNLNKPIHLMARSSGRVRQKRLIN